MFHIALFLNISYYKYRRSHPHAYEYTLSQSVSNMVYLNFLFPLKVFNV